MLEGGPATHDIGQSAGIRTGKPGANEKTYSSIGQWELEFVFGSQWEGENELGACVVF